MSSVPAVYNWDKIVLKPVLTKDNQDVGNVICVEQDTVTIHHGRYEYKVSKNDVEGFNGGEVFWSKIMQICRNLKLNPNFLF